MTVLPEGRAPSPRLICWAGLLIATAYLIAVGGTYPGIASVHAQIIIQGPCIGDSRDVGLFVNRTDFAGDPIGLRKMEHRRAPELGPLHVLRGEGPSTLVQGRP